jgi:drug/metabolite transporter (DMT)-like permease
MNPAKPSHPLLPVAGLLFSATLWGIVWYPLRLLEAGGLAGAWSALVSYSAALLACAWVFVRQSRAVAENTLYLLLMALAAGWCNVAFIMAVLDGTVVRVLLLFYLSPFWAVLLGWLMLGERLDTRSMFVFIVAVCGAMVMLWDSAIGAPWPSGTADWLAVSSGFAFALSNVFVRKLHHVTVLLKSGSSFLGVVVVAAAWVMVLDIGMPAARPAVFGYAVLLGLAGFLVMALAVQYGVTHMPLHRSAVILLFELVVGAVSALLLTDEVVLPREWLGGGMIVLAAWVAAYIHAGEEA